MHSNCLVILDVYTFSDFPVVPISSNGEMGPNMQTRGGGASVGAIFGGLLIAVLLIVMIAVICYRRG